MRPPFQNSEHLLLQQRHRNELNYAPFPHIISQNPMAFRQRYTDESDFKALLRKLYCRLHLTFRNTGSGTQTVNVFGRWIPPTTLEGAYSFSRRHDAGMPVTGNIVSGFAENTALNEVWAVAYNTDSRGEIYIIDDSPGSNQDIVEVLDINAMVGASLIKPVAIAKVNTQMYVLCNEEVTNYGVVVRINATTHAFVDYFPVTASGNIAANIVFNATENVIYVGDITTGNINVFTTGGTFVIAIAATPWNFALHPTLNRLYCVDEPFENGDIQVIDCSTNTVIDTITLPGGGLEVTTGTIAYNPNTGQMQTVGITVSSTILYAIDSSNNLSTQFDANRVSLGLSWLTLAVSDASTRIAVGANRTGSGRIALVNGSSLSQTLSTDPNESVLFISSTGTLYAAAIERINIYQPAENSIGTLPEGVELISDNGGFDYDAILRDIYFNPIVCKHTHVKYSGLAELSNSFTLNWADSSGFRSTDLFPMRVWEAATSPDQLTQDIFSFNDVTFDGRQWLSFPLLGGESMFLEFYYYQVNLPELLRQKLIVS